MLTQRTNKISQQEKKKIAKTISQYLQTRVMPILIPLQFQLLAQKPHSVQVFSIQWLKKQSKKQNYSLSSHSKLKDSVLESDDQPEQIFKQKRRQKLALSKRNRFGIKGDNQKQVNLNGRESYLSTAGFQWSKEATVNLIVNLKKCIFFQHLENNELIRLTQRMRKVELQPDQIIIREGEYGNQLYIVDSGRLICRKMGSNEVLKNYCKGQIFGQLSLLYNNPRATTVTAIEKCNLFALSRAGFAATMQYGMLQKLRQCQELTEKVDIFSSLNLYERSKLYQSMKIKNMGPEKYIIKEGETGDCFYIVAEGQLVAYKSQKGENKLVYTYKRGGYFGQLALLRRVPRQASIKTLTDVRLYYIDSECFSRVLGSFEAILKRNEDKYARITTELFGNLKPSE